MKNQSYLCVFNLITGVYIVQVEKYPVVGQVSLLDEPTGPAAEATDRAERVGRRFIEYLELLQPEGVDDGPEIEIEFEVEMEDEDTPDEPVADASAAATESDTEDGMLAEVSDALVQEMEVADLSSEQRRELLLAAAHRLTGTDDPTALSYVLTALIQVDLAARQELLEAPDTVERLTRLDGLLTRESWFLRQGLRPIIIDPRGSSGQG